MCPGPADWRRPRRLGTRAAGEGKNPGGGVGYPVRMVTIRRLGFDRLSCGGFPPRETSSGTHEPSAPDGTVKIRSDPHDDCLRQA